MDHPVTGGPFWTGDKYENIKNRRDHPGIPSGRRI